MNERDILKQFESLKALKPDPEFRSNNRELLLSQISGSVEAKSPAGSVWFRSILDTPARFAQRLTQPVLVVLLISVFVLGGGIAGIRASQDTKPGDSLYIAKIVSEKTHLALTFDDSKKARLGLEFAGNRARELNQILAEQAGDEKETRERQETVKKLKDDFKKEITVAKDRIAKISTEARKEEADKAEKEAARDAEEGAAEEAEEESSVFSANLGKEDNGIQTSEQTEIEETVAVEDSEPGADEEVPAEIEEAEASTTPQLLDGASTTEEFLLQADASDPEELLEQAGLLLDSEDYEATISKLEEAGMIFDDTEDTGTVKGESEEGATSTDEALEEEDAAAEDGEVLGAEEDASNEESASSTEK